MNVTSYDVAYSLHTRTIICVIFCFFIILPLSLIKNMHGFRYISLVVIGCMIYTIAVMLIQLPSYAKVNYSPERIVWFNWDIQKILTGSTICFFAYTC